MMIRHLVTSDYVSWLGLWDGYNAFYGRSGSTALAANITACTWQRFFDPYEPMHCLVAETEGALCGIVHFLLHRSTTAIEPSVYLQDLFTHPDQRGSGIGRALIEAVYAKANTMGCSRVYWQTHETNIVAQQLYDRLADRSGFIVYGKRLPM